MVREISYRLITNENRRSRKQTKERRGIE